MQRLPHALLTEGVDLAGSTSSLNSQPHATHLDPELARRGVLFGSLDQLVGECGDRLRPYLFAAVDYHADKFAALHAACWSGGTLVYVPKGVVIDRPLHMLSALSPGGVDFGHVLIVLEEDAEATVLAETASVPRLSQCQPPACTAGPSKSTSGPRAKLRYVNLQDWGAGVWHFAHQRALVRQRRRPAMDHRRAGQPSGQSEPARGPGRARRQRTSQRRHVHRRQAAPFLSHAATSPVPALHERFALQRGPTR